MFARLMLLAALLMPQAIIHIDQNPIDPVPVERKVAWTVGTTVGVPGGIPTTRTQCVTTECQAVTNAAVGYKDGTLDASALLQAAIDSALASTYVLMPSGTWRIDTTLTIGQARDSITLRGSGSTATILDCRASTCIFAGSQSDFAWAWPTSGNSVTAYAPDGGTGGTVLTISDTSQFTVNQLVQYAVENLTDLPALSDFGYPNMRRQMTQVVAKTSGSLTVFPPIYGYQRFVGHTAIVHVAQFQGDGIGVESLKIDGANGTVLYGIQFDQTFGSWVSDVFVINSNNYNVFFVDSLFCELRRSRLDQLNHGGSNGAGLLFNTNSGGLVEDNIIIQSFPNIEINHGSSGNVFAYNFLHNTDGSISIDSNHGPHNAFNLFEGNVSTNLMSDGYFGTESESTVFRNLLHGNGIDGGDTLSYCLSLKRFARNFSLVGNVFGTSLHVAGRCDAYGQPNIGNGSSSGTAQPSAADYWADWTPSGSTITGTLTTRTSATVGVVTVATGTLVQDQAPRLWSSDGSTTYTQVQVGVVSGALAPVDASAYSGTLPALNTVLLIWAGNAGFQELDLDVELTTLKKANNDRGSGIPQSESIGTSRLRDSMFRAGKPAWFYALTWPPVNSASPTYSYEIIPAGWRYMHGGANPPS